MNPRHNFQYAPADHPLFFELADIAARREVIIDLHMEAITEERPTPSSLRQACDANPQTLKPTIPALERLLAHNRQARLVWQHIGWDNVGDMKPELIARLLKANDNLFVAWRVEARVNQVGGGGPMPNRLVDTQGRLKPEWLTVLETYSDRIVIGSDEFIGPSGRKPKLAASFDETWSLVDKLPADLRKKIGGDNARRIYGLDRQGSR